MSVTINHIATHFSLKINGPIKWGMDCMSKKSGVYIICYPGTSSACPLDMRIINFWCSSTRNKTFKTGSPLIPSVLVSELTKYWIPNEQIVYVGKASCLRTRLFQYYRTPLGKRGPHSGGYWIKTLQNINMLDIYWIEDKKPAILEQKILVFFNKSTTCGTGMLCLPYANLEITRRLRKRHIIRRPNI